jgi:hypothetical protein
MGFANLFIKSNIFFIKSSFLIFFAAAFVTVFGAGFSAALLAAVLVVGFFGVVANLWFDVLAMIYSFGTKSASC